ncbi:Protein zntD [Frankliniella fusca]|uniref:Protein zntD n=1 Tax=Frankliniella fusca TaxID=407009 RepID=A0AAE1LND1_9NEOP|nr:Protein zntD [Frankliniella fusca]
MNGKSILLHCTAWFSVIYPDLENGNKVKYANFISCMKPENVNSSGRDCSWIGVFGEGLFFECRCAHIFQTEGFS